MPWKLDEALLNEMALEMMLEAEQELDHASTVLLARHRSERVSAAQMVRAFFALRSSLALRRPHLYAITPPERQRSQCPSPRAACAPVRTPTCRTGQDRGS